jgi:hypothetical protein
MLEYVFFDAGFRDRFVTELDSLQVLFQLSDSNDELLVLVDEDIDDELEESIESVYEQLMREQATAVDAQENPHEMVHIVGIQYIAADGSVCQVRLSPNLVNRLARCLSSEELQQLVQTIADDVARADQRPLCEQ